MKTPSFLEIKSLVEYLTDELNSAQLQEVMATEDGLVLAFYRFGAEPRMAYLVFDLDKTFPFLGYFYENPWFKQKKTKPVSLFLNAHAKNLIFSCFEVSEDLGRVIRLNLGTSHEVCRIEFRLIPKQTNLIVQFEKKSISWSPVIALVPNNLKYTINQDEEVRSIQFMMNQWLRCRAINLQTSNSERVAQSPFDKWKKNREKDLAKKQKAILAVEEQISKFKNEVWGEVGEFLKNNSVKSVKPEWVAYVNFEWTSSENMQNCFEKSKMAKVKIKGAEARLLILRSEVKSLENPSQEQYEIFLNAQNQKKNKSVPRQIEGRLRKIQISESDLTAYMGKSARDNMDLLKKSKPYDIWLHLKDYPSAHAIIHRQKLQKVTDADIKKIATWLVKEGLTEKKSQLGGKYYVVYVECRHVKALKGDKLGRVSYHNSREILIAI